ncbi:MAG: VanZ family protein [Candidatus Zixiibacteriota bacterium]
MPVGTSPGRVFVRYHAPMLFFASAIITVSSIPDLKGPQLQFIPFDKLAHFLEYAVFAILAYRSFSQLVPQMNLDLAYVLCLLFVALFAGFDEYYQRYVPGRYTDVKDFATDLAGAVLVGTFLWLRSRRNAQP